MVFALDVLAMISAFVAAGLWLQASRTHLRRVTKSEILDAADFNRVVVSFNRTQTINARAALATGASALFVGIRYATSLFG